MISNSDGNNGDDIKNGDVVKNAIDFTVNNVTTLLGKDFNFQIKIGEDGSLFLSIDGISDPTKYIELISKKCDVPIHTVMPLILTNYSLVFNRESPVKETSPFLYETIKPTIH